MSKLFEYYKVYEELEQGTEEWLNVRKLKFTGSVANTIATNGKGLDTLVKEKLAEVYSTKKYLEYTNSIKTPDMQRGNEYEDIARMIYEFETGYKVNQVGFIERSKYIGVSPDGLINDDGLVEFKCHKDKVFIELLLTDEIDKNYIDEMQYQLWVSERKWVDYCGFNPNFSPNFYICRFYPDLEKFKKFEIGVTSGIEKIKQGLLILDKKLQKESEEK